MRLTIDGKSVNVTARDAIGKGGEADVYDLHDGSVLKVSFILVLPQSRNWRGGNIGTCLHQPRGA